MIDDLDTWKDEFEKLPYVDTIAKAADQLSTFVANRVNGKLTVKQLYNTSGTIKLTPFTFDKDVFKSELLSLKVTPSKTQGALNYSNAWFNAMQASSVLTVPPGSVIWPSTTPTPPPTPQVILSSVVVQMVDAPSIAAAKSYIYSQLLAAQPVSKKREAPLVKILYEAFTKLTCSVNGLNSLSPTPAPLNLISSPVE